VLPNRLQFVVLPERVGHFRHEIHGSAGLSAPQPPFRRRICAPPLRGCTRAGLFGDRRRHPSSQSPDHESRPPCSRGAADRALPADSPPCNRFPLSHVLPCISAAASSWALLRPGWGSGGSRAERVHFENVGECNRADRVERRGRATSVAERKWDTAPGKRINL
jgi:hypothetical protein